jgi:hypothetical protein
VGQGCEGRIEIWVGAGVEDMYLRRKSAGCPLHGSYFSLGSQIGRVDEQRNYDRCGSLTSC